MSEKQVDQYIAKFPPETQEQLEAIRAIIRKAAPKAEEVINYAMPGYKMNKVIVWFAGYKSHVGFYPTPGPIKEFAAALKRYKTTKGAIQFPLEEKIPAALVTKIVKYRLKEDAEQVKIKPVTKNKRS